MSEVKTQAEADLLNLSGEYGPYRAANHHLMVAPLRWPRGADGNEREYRVGDEIKYDSWAARCDPGCRHYEAPEDW